jgi:peptidoglycan hydrolase-like protein with peptidoglycan-binding domain
MLKRISIAILTLAFVLPSLVLGQANASSKDLQTIVKELQEQIKSLQDQITILNKQIEGQNKEIQNIKTEVAFTKTLQRGMTGDEVKKLQEFLKQFPDIYPEGLVTGYYGSLTETAVRKLQEKQGLPAVGFVGPKTLEKLNALTTTGTSTAQSEPVTPGATGTSTPSLPVSVTTASTTTVATTTPNCTGNYSTCSSKSACESAKFFWYTLSCHPNPPPSNSCAASYNYCPVGPECAANGWYSCRNSCYGSADACLGQTYLPSAGSSAVSTPTPSSGSGTSVVGTTTTTSTVTSTSTSSSATTTSITPTPPPPTISTLSNAPIIASITPYVPLPLNEHFISSVTLQWNAVTNPTNYLTYYKAWRKLGNGDWLYWANTQQTTFPDLNLGRGTYYYYVNACYTTTGSPLVLVTDNCSPDSNIMTATLAGGGDTSDITPPGTPTNLTASIVNSDSPYISWTASTDNVGVAGYNIYRNGTYLMSVCCTSVIDGSVSRSTTANYTVAAYDVAGNISAQSSPVSSAAVSSTSFDQHTSNLATIYYALESIKAILENLSKLLQ